MKRIVLVSIPIIVLTILSIFLIKLREERVCFNNDCFIVDIADTREKRQEGLMYRSSLPPERGMLFVFEESGNHSFWMKNTLMSLDIIWISDGYEVVYMAKNQPPCNEEICPIISPDRGARYVLEINSGKSDEIGLSVGDNLEFEMS